MTGTGSAVNLNVTGMLNSSGAFNSSGGLTASGQIISTRSNNTATNLGQIYLNGAVGNRIDFNQNGIAIPAFTTRSLGTKIVIGSNVSASSTDYAIGLESTAMWQSIPTALSTSQVKWYGGTTQIAQLTGNGNLSVTGSISSPSISSTGTISASTLSSTSTISTPSLTVDD